MSLTEHQSTGEPLVASCRNGGPFDLSLLDGALAGRPGEKTALLPLLETAQDLYGYLPPEVLQYLATRLNISLGQVYSVATFYTELRVRRCGQHILQVCDGLSCYLSGGGSRLLPFLKARLGIRPGETTPDDCFTLETVQCLACCDEGPTMRVADRLYQHLTPSRVDAILEELRGES